MDVATLQYILLGLFAGSILLKGLFKVTCLAIEADEKADSDFGYYGKYARPDSWQ